MGKYSTGKQRCLKLIETNKGMGFLQILCRSGSKELTLVKLIQNILNTFSHNEISTAWWLQHINLWGDQSENNILIVGLLLSVAVVKRLPVLAVNSVIVTYFEYICVWPTWKRYIFAFSSLDCNFGGFGLYFGKVWQPLYYWQNNLK